MAGRLSGRFVLIVLCSAVCLYALLYIVPEVIFIEVKFVYVQVAFGQYGGNARDIIRLFVYSLYDDGMYRGVYRRGEALV